MRWIVQINTFEIKTGKLDAFKRSVQAAQDFAKEHDRILMAEMHIDEEAMLARALLIHRDSESILEHWRISDDRMSEVMEFCEPRSVELLGRPSDAVLANLAKFEEAGIRVTVAPPFAGYSRLREE